MIYYMGNSRQRELIMYVCALDFVRAPLAACACVRVTVRIACALCTLVRMNNTQ